MTAFNDIDYQAFTRFLEQQSGIVLGDSKQYLVRSRLSPLVSHFQLASLQVLLKEVVQGVNRELRLAVVDAMTTNETLWFRDGYPFEMLGKQILPELAKKQRAIKIWSAALRILKADKRIMTIGMIAHSTGKLKL